MDEQNHAQNDEWQSRWLHAVAQLATAVRDLDDINPWAKQPLLPQAINYLVTELWDRGFSQTEIRTAFAEAVADMPRYAACEEVRR